jgi:hypothetical protein
MNIPVTVAENNTAVKAAVPRSGDLPLFADYRTYMPKQPIWLESFYITSGSSLTVKVPPGEQVTSVTATASIGVESVQDRPILATEASYSGREQRMNRFIGMLREIGEISPDMAQQAWQGWQLLKAAARTLSVPDASSGRNGEFLYIWDRGDHHLELEIYPGGTADFFYAHRTAGHLWGAEYRIGDPLNQDILERLKLFG